MVAFYDDYADSTSATAASNVWENDTSGWSTNYLTIYDRFEDLDEPSAEEKRALQLEISRAWPNPWWQRNQRSSVNMKLEHGRRGWKSVTQVFFLSPQRVASQRFDWQH